jgi:hypothetical protein
MSQAPGGQRLHFNARRPGDVKRHFFGINTVDPPLKDFGRHAF